MGQVKRRFQGMEKLLMRQMRTGWCPINGTIIMDDDWWKKARMVSVGV
jgi:hypothetical protein